MSAEGQRASSLAKNGWTVDLRSGVWGKLFPGDDLPMIATTTLEACQIESAERKAARAEQVQAQIQHLEQNGWIKSEVQEAWKLPHWERSEPGFYIAKLKRAYAQQLKFDADAKYAEFRKAQAESASALKSALERLDA